MRDDLVSSISASHTETVRESARRADEVRIRDTREASEAPARSSAGDTVGVRADAGLAQHAQAVKAVGRAATHVEVAQRSVATAQRHLGAAQALAADSQGGTPSAPRGDLNTRFEAELKAALTTLSGLPQALAGIPPKDGTIEPLFEIGPLGLAGVKIETNDGAAAAQTRIEAAQRKVDELAASLADRRAEVDAAAQQLPPPEAPVTREQAQLTALQLLNTPAAAVRSQASHQSPGAVQALLQ